MRPTQTHAVVFDFDGTLLPKTLASAMRIIELKLYSPASLTRVDRHVARHKDSIVNGTITPHDSEQGWRFTHDLYAREGVTLGRVRKALRDARLRDGAADCLRLLRRRGIPTAIISCGVAALIPPILEANGVADCVTAIYATRIGFDRRSGALLPYEPHRHVSAKDKGNLSREFAARHGVAPANLLAVGDSRGDRKLGHLKKNRLGLAADADEAALLAPFMGCVLVTKSFRPVTDWLLKKLKSA